MPKSMVMAVGFSASTCLANRAWPPTARSPPIPELRKVKSQVGNRVVRYSSISVEYWYCSVMLSPRKTIWSPFLKKNSPADSAWSCPAAVKRMSKASVRDAGFMVGLLGKDSVTDFVLTGGGQEINHLLEER